MKNHRLEIRINSETKEALSSIAGHLAVSGTMSELLTMAIEDIIAKHKHLIGKELIPKVSRSH